MTPPVYFGFFFTHLLYLLISSSFTHFYDWSSQGCSHSIRWSSGSGPRCRATRWLWLWSRSPWRRCTCLRSVSPCPVSACCWGDPVWWKAALRCSPAPLYRCCRCSSLQRAEMMMSPDHRHPGLHPHSASKSTHSHSSSDAPDHRARLLPNSWILETQQTLGGVFPLRLSRTSLVPEFNYTEISFSFSPPAAAGD